LTTAESGNRKRDGKKGVEKGGTKTRGEKCGKCVLCGSREGKETRAQKTSHRPKELWRMVGGEEGSVGIKDFSKEAGLEKTYT